MLSRLLFVIPAISTLLFIAGLSDPANVSADVKSSTSEKLILCREAWLAWRNQLRSGLGEGILENYVNGKMIAKAKVKVSFAPNRYRVEMDFLKKSDTNSKQIAIYNNDNMLFHVRYFHVNPKIEIKEGNCYDIQDAYIPPVQAGFPFSPCHPIMAIGSTVMESSQLKLHRVKDDGVLVLRYQEPNIYLEIEASKKYGFNVCRISSYRDGFDNTTASREKIDWDKHNGIWFIKAIERELTFFNSGKRSGNQLCRFSYSTFTVNPEFDKNLYSIDSTGLPEGARILDNRQQSTQRVYRYTRSRGHKEKDDGLFSEIQQLPSGQKKQSIRQEPVSHRGRSFTRWKIGFSITGVMFLLLGAVIYRKSRTRTINGSSQAHPRAE